MSEYELSLMRQRGIAARDSKAKRGEFRFMLPPGFCWGEAGKIEIDPDEHVAGAIRLVFAKFRELGSARQVFLWLRSADIKMPVVLRNVDVCKVVWKAPAYHSVMQILHNPLYAGAYAFGRRTQRTHIVNGRARKVSGFAKPREEWSFLLHDNQRALRCVAVGRHNWTFAGSDEGGRRAAAVYTLVETCKLNGVAPRAWLADGLARLPDHPARRIGELLPWNWKRDRIMVAA